MSEPFIFGCPPRPGLAIATTTPTQHIDPAFASTDDLYQLVGLNSGNLAFGHAIHAHLGGNVRSVMWRASAEVINQAGTVAVLPAANQLGTHVDYRIFTEKLKRVTVPIVTIGLGAQSNLQHTIPSIPEGTVNWVRCLADHAPSDSPSIGVRGSFTMDVLDHLGLSSHAVVIGCPSLFINPTPVLGKKVAERLRTPDRVAVVAGHQHWHQLGLRGIEASLVQLVTETNGCYVAQAPVEMMALTRGMAESIDDATLRICRDYVQPNLDLSEFIDWSARYGNVFFDVDSWIEHYKRFDFVIGTRIHGTVLGIQAGVPSLCIVHDSRTLELCETLKIPHVFPEDVQDGINRDDLVSLFNFDADAFDKNRRTLCRRYVQFLKANRLVPAKWLEDIASYREEDPVAPSQVVP